MKVIILQHILRTFCIFASMTFNAHADLITAFKDILQVFKHLI